MRTWETLVWGSPSWPGDLGVVGEDKMEGRENQPLSALRRSKNSVGVQAKTHANASPACSGCQDVSQQREEVGQFVQPQRESNQRPPSVGVLLSFRVSRRMGVKGLGCKMPGKRQHNTDLLFSCLRLYV